MNSISISIDYSVDRFFCERKDELRYGRTKLQTLIFKEIELKLTLLITLTADEQSEKREIPRGHDH